MGLFSLNDADRKLIEGLSERADKVIESLSGVSEQLQVIQRSNASLMALLQDSKTKNGAMQAIDQVLGQMRQLEYAICESVSPAVAEKIRARRSQFDGQS